MTARLVTTRLQAHEAVQAAYLCAQQLIADGKRVRITCAEDDDDLSVRQRRFLHGPVLGQISEQVVVEGHRYTQAIWKQHLKNLFLPDKWEARHALVWDADASVMRRGKRKTPHRVAQHTEDLGLKAYSLFIDQSIAHAVTEWGVTFQFLVGEREAAQYTTAPRQRKQQKEEATA